MNNLSSIHNRNFLQVIALAIIFLLTSALFASAQSPTPTPTPEATPVGLPADPPEVAPQYTAPTRPLPAADRVGVDVTAQKSMSLDEVIKLTLQNSNDITVAETTVKIAEFGLKAARGVYDPVFANETSYFKSKMPSASSLGSADGSLTTSSFANIATLTGFTPFAGGNYQFQFQSSRDTSSNTFNTLNPQFPSAFSFTYVQPLFRNADIDSNRRNIKIAKRNLSLTDAQFRQNSIEVINNVVLAYWDLTYALRNLQVQIDAVKQARLQVESNKRQVSEGVLAPVEILEAETQVTIFEQQVYAAQQAVTTAENNLKSLMLRTESDPIWTQAIVPTTPVNVTPPVVTVEEAVAQAKANRPEFEQLRATKDINQINKAYFKNQTRPRIDLTAGYTSNGLAGSLLNNSGGGFLDAFSPLITRVNELSVLSNLPPININTGGSQVPGSLVGNYGTSLKNMFSMNNPTYQIGVRIELPIGNRTAKANYGSALVEETQIKARMDQTDQIIKSEVQNALQAIRTAQARLNAAAATRSSSEQLYESERRRYDNGTSTIFLVLERQQRLVTARGQELQSQVDLNKAISNFQKAIGTTFESHNVELKKSSSNITQRPELNIPAKSDMDNTGFSPSSPRTSAPVVSKATTSID